MNPHGASQAGPPGPDPGPGPDEKKNFHNPYILYPSPGIIGWPNGAAPVQNPNDSNRPLAYGSAIHQQFNPQGGLPVLQSFPSGFVGFENQAAGASSERRKTNRTPVACVVCHKAKSTCDRNRPCARCRRLGKAHLCKDRPHRKKGRPRKRLLNSAEETAGDPDPERDSIEKKASEKKSRPGPQGATTSSSDPNRRDSFKLSDCYLGSDMPKLMANITKSGKSEGGDQGQSSSSANGTDSASTGTKTAGVDTPLTELQNSFAQMAKAVNDTLWEEIIGDMSAYITDAKQYERKYKTLFSKIPNVKRILNPLFCMYLTHMSYYLHPEQFINLQKKMASSGVLIPNGSSDKIRKFDENLMKTVDCKAIAPISRLRWCLKHPRPHMESRFARIDNWPLATIKVNMFNTPDPMTLLVYVSVNEEFERIFGFRQAEMVLMSRRPFYYRLIHPKDWKKQLSLEMSTLLGQRKRFNTLIRCVCKWKEEIVCLETFRFSFDEEDTLNHFTISFTPLPRYMFK
mmetsp:Transcript_11006/g.15322  ORF Transcript_11006/g.15322 Transcript_11006/m.15322 type:complete len:514 (+) Transcript_11006:225-1766(+)